MNITVKKLAELHMPALHTTCLVGSLWMMQRASFWSRPTLVAGLWRRKLPSRMPTR